MDTQTQYKTFADLDFNTREWDNAQVATLNLGNDITISVVGGTSGLYGDGIETWEIAFFQDGDFIPLSKFDDVLGWQTEADVTRHMRDAQVNGNAWVQLLKEIRAEFRKEMDLD